MIADGTSRIITKPDKNATQQWRVISAAAQRMRLTARLPKTARDFYIDFRTLIRQCEQYNLSCLGTEIEAAGFQGFNTATKCHSTLPCAR